MVSKGDLGVSDLVAVGVVLFGIFSAEALVPMNAGAGFEVRSILGFSLGGMIAGSFLVTGISLSRSTLDDDRVWRVAGWSTVGLGLPTLGALLVILFVPSLLTGVGWRSVILVGVGFAVPFVVATASGAVGGALVYTQVHEPPSDPALSRR